MKIAVIGIGNIGGTLARKLSAAGHEDGVPQSVPVVDTGNYYPDLRDPHIPELDAGKIESVSVSEQIGRPIIKAFNNILSHALAEEGRPPGSPGRIATAVAGNALASKNGLGAKPRS
jgi:8-hydroxy-5-deazaflavin:NADPH oxidoreductase